ncbi:sn-glycerol-3-phosphate ABC transporter ATP-binding protein UgpC [Rhodoferax sp.]|uniref:ABC transporter ATP-binding protein n=1 Tax=Rhodoferax sp. TaxID=50421 RepID=UPI0025E24E45|nr:sn-glycerol-3-phosphate ABC transporter ATP-binding protein UgpC [Rhodoferax sp.]
MAGIQLNRVSKHYGNVVVMSDLSLDIAQDEFLVFLGPSGCGKSTLLRMMAGLEPVTSGSITINGKDVTDLPPGQRGVAMVFQHYALYPHMTVYDNVAFGMRNIGLAEAEISTRITDAARMLELDALLQRKPGQLSGGQRQRVAIGRSIVKNPSAFLFDEPLSNLDASLRTRTRVELARLHQRLQSTMVFVTHDQVEAMTLATRIVVMNKGCIEQIGAPMDIYRRPATRFVAGFIGQPAMNFLDTERAAPQDGRLSLRIAHGSVFQTALRDADVPAGQLTLGIRAESITLDPQGELPGRVDVVERLGDRTLVHVGLADGSNVVAEAHRDSGVAPGEAVALRIDSARLHVFDAAGLAHHAPQ